MKRLILSLSLLSFLYQLSHGQDNWRYVPSESNLEMREWFRDAKFGLFIHWGVYSQMAGGGDMGIAEWIMQRKEIPIQSYEMLPSFFNPIAFNADDWVKTVKQAGMNYITITSKHHDGFAMYDSKISNYDIVERTPYGKDVLAQLKEACDKHGVKLFFYYSQLDWHHPDYYPRGRTGQGYTGRPDSGDWDNYIEYMNTQLEELLTNYGEIGGIWFDGMWDQWDADWKLEETYKLIHKLQPNALIGSNHHKAPFPGEDFQMFERDLPGQNTMGFNQTSSISDLPLEMCETMNGSWGYNIKDRRFKSSKHLIHTLVRAAGYGANFLLNTGPMPNGMLQPENIDTLKIIGAWLKENGEAIYGSRRGPIVPKKWGAITSKDNLLYIHILDLEEEALLLPEFSGKIKTAEFFKSGDKVVYEQSDFGLLMKIPNDQKQAVDTIIKVQLK